MRARMFSYLGLGRWDIYLHVCMCVEYIYMCSQLVGMKRSWEVTLRLEPAAAAAIFTGAASNAARLRVKRVRSSLLIVLGGR